MYDKANIKIKKNKHINVKWNNTNYNKKKIRNKIDIIYNFCMN